MLFRDCLADLLRHCVLRDIAVSPRCTQISTGQEAYKGGVDAMVDAFAAIEFFVKERPHTNTSRQRRLLPVNLGYYHQRRRPRETATHGIVDCSTNRPEAGDVKHVFELKYGSAS
jgi:hypothetical protein